jgi:hypothetical protein
MQMMNLQSLFPVLFQMPCESLIFTSRLAKYFQTNSLFLDVSCEFGPFSPQMWKVLGKKIPKTPFVNFALR